MSLASDDDSFNEPIEDDNLSEDSFNQPLDEDEDEDAFAEDAEGALQMAASSSSRPLPGPSSSPQLAFQMDTKQGEYEVLDEAALRASMDALTQDVAGVMFVPNHLASMLLRAHNWNKEKFVGPYFEDPDRFLANLGLQFMAEDGEAGFSRSALERDAESKEQSGKGASSTNSQSVSSNSASVSSVSSPSPSSASLSFNCPVCYDDYSLDSTLALGCAHRFCHGCYKIYLETAVQDGRNCISTRCAAFKCPILVPDKTFQNLTPADTFTRHQEYLLRSFVEDSRLLRWCPAQRCNYAVRSYNSSLLAVRCKCGHSFCFQCAEENHAPVSCDNLQLWLEKCKNESETAHWIMVNTKKCPRCGIRIEKNQGCNHMTCRGCKFEWCWVCHSDWASHGNHTGGYYKCNKWDPRDSKSSSDKGSADSAKAELNRYLHYYQRYHNHDQSRRFAEKQKLLTEKRMASLHAQSGGEAAWIDFQFLETATKQVLECRNVLKHTYVFAYYLSDGPEKSLFEFLQQQLESATEQLSELSELPPLEKIDRPQVVNYTRITKKFLENLLNSCAAGLTAQ